MPDVLSNGETALWRAVVLQAFQDATLGLHGASARGKPPRLSAERRVHAGAARTWLLRNSADFRQVCNLAGLEPEAVRRAAQVAITRSEEQLSEINQHQAQPNSQKRPAGERVLARRLVSEGDIGPAN